MTPANQEGRGAFKLPIVDDRMDPTLRELLERTIAYERSLTDQKFVAERERSDATYSSLVKLVEHRIDPLDRRIVERISELDRRIGERFALNDGSVAEARQVIKERLAGMNEFRDALKDQAGRMATRVELEKMEETTRNTIGKLDETVRELQRAKANLDGRLIVMSGGVSAFISLALSLALWWITKAAA